MGIGEGGRTGLGGGSASWGNEAMCDGRRRRIAMRWRAGGGDGGAALFLRERDRSREGRQRGHVVRSEAFDSMIRIGAQSGGREIGRRKERGGIGDLIRRI